MKNTSQHTEEIIKLLVDKYHEIDTDTLAEIIEDIQHLHMQILMEERHKEMQMRGYQMSN